MSLPPPPPPNPNFAQQPVGPPPGYTPYVAGATGQVMPSKGLSKAMVVVFWCTTATAALVGFALYRRKTVWDDVVNGDGTFADLDGADSLVGGLIVLQLALLLTSAIVCCLWSRRIAENAKARGVLDVKPGLAAGGWFIPLGWFWVGFNQLKKSVAGVGGNSPSLAKWQMFFVGQAIAGWLINRFGNFDTAGDPGELSDRLRNQGLVGLVGVVLYAGATIFAAKAAREINTAVTGDA